MLVERFLANLARNSMIDPKKSYLNIATVQPYMTNIGPLSGVNVQMAREIGLLMKSFSTDVTDEALTALRVDPLVGGEGGGPGERFEADFADVGPHVRPVSHHVLAQGRLLAERPGAVRLRAMKIALP